MKPILFNTEMVKAIQKGKKTVTRRVIKQLVGADIPPDTKFWVSLHSGLIYWGGTDQQLTIDGKPVMEPYHTGDILYVRETWAMYREMETAKKLWFYKADGDPHKTIYDDNGIKLEDQRIEWHSSIHMPKEAARLFLRVTDVRVERLQDMRLRDFLCYGIKLLPGEYDTDFVDTAPRVQKTFMELWDSTIKPTNRALYGWDANPWVWVIEFEKISKEEILKSKTEEQK